MVEGRKTGDKESKVRGVVVLHAEVVHHQDEGNRARGVAEKTGGKGLMKVKRLKQGDKSKIGELTCLFEAVHRFLYTENDVRLSRFILLDEGEKRKARQDFGRKEISIDFNKLRVSKGRFEIKVGQVNRTKVSVRRDNRVEQDVHTRERGNKS